MYVRVHVTAVAQVHVRAKELTTPSIMFHGCVFFLSSASSLPPISLLYVTIACKTTSDPTSYKFGCSCYRAPYLDYKELQYALLAYTSLLYIPVRAVSVLLVIVRISNFASALVFRISPCCSLVCFIFASSAVRRASAALLHTRWVTVLKLASIVFGAAESLIVFDSHKIEF